MHKRGRVVIFVIVILALVSTMAQAQLPALQRGFTRQVGSSQADVAQGVALANDGSIYTVGYTEGSLNGETALGGLDAVVMKHDAVGTLLWTRQFGTSADDVALGVDVNGAGQALVVGWTKGSLTGTTNQGLKDGFAVLFNADGSTQWSRLIGGSANDQATGAAFQTNGAMIVVGQVWGNLGGHTSNGAFDAFIIKYDTAGVVVWTRLLGSSADDTAYGVACVGTTEIYVTGTSTGNLPTTTNPGSLSGYVARYDNSGNRQWVTMIGTNSVDYAHAVAVDSNSNVAYVVGHTLGTMAGQSSSGSFDMFVARVSTVAGVLQTPVAQFGTSGVDYAYGVDVDITTLSDVGVFVVGATQGVLPGAGNTNAGNLDVALMRVHANNGTLMWAKQYGTPSEDRAFGVRVGSSGVRLALAGMTAGALDDQTSAGDQDWFFTSTNSTCPRGSYGHLCTLCAAGTAGTEADALSCPACAAGKFTAVAGSTSCVDCVAGTYNGNTGRSACTGCGLGSFSTATGATSSAVCSACNPGTYGDTTGLSSCLSCAKGTYRSSTGGTSASDCTGCAAGKFGNQTARTNENDACFFCDVGSFGDSAGRSACLLCDPGKYAGAIGATGCASCLPGTYNTQSGLGQCDNCPAGTKGNVTAGVSLATACFACPVGEFSGSAASTTCQPCAEGRFANTTGLTACLPCDRGSYANATGLAQCLLCAAGSFGNVIEGVNATSACSECPAGSYSTAAGATVCTSCPSGTFQNASGQTSESNACFSCAAGSFSSGQSASSCAFCPMGKFGNVSGAANESAACRVCDPGTYNAINGSTACTRCPYDTFGNASAQTSQAAACYACVTSGAEYTPGTGATSCATCPAGNALVRGNGATTPSTCTPCARGSYAGTPGVATCTLCSAGKFGNATGQSVESAACYQCAAGSYSMVGGVSACTLCGVGKFGTAVGASTEPMACQSCADGRGVNATGATTCTNCTVGTYASSATTGGVCRPCPAGAYASSPASSSCTPCAAGTFGNVTGQSNQTVACHVCPKGTYASGTGNTACTPCAPGTFGNTTGNTDAGQCHVCLAGAYQPDSGSTACLLCGVGRYGNRTAGVSRDSACPLCTPGTYSGVEGASACVGCVAGKYGTLSGTTSAATGCVDCARGAYTTTSGNGACTLCAPGKYGLATGSNNESNACAVCPKGAYQGSAGQTACVQCPTGSYGNSTAQTSAQQACTLCPRGEYASVTGQTSCLKCPVGTQGTTLGATDLLTGCSDCSAGSYAPMQGMAMCTPCAVGKYGTATKATSEAAACVVCAQGTYNGVVGQSSCQACPKGTAGNGTQATSAGWCVPCAAGTKSDSAGEDSCDACPVGSYQSATGATLCLSCGVGTYGASTGLTECTNCTAGTFLNATAGSDAAECGPCPVDTYQPDPGMAECLPCAFDELCAPGTVTPVKCPSRHTKPVGATLLDQCVPFRQQELASQVIKAGKDVNGRVVNETNVAWRVQDDSAATVFFWVPPNGNPMTILTSWEREPQDGAEGTTKDFSAQGQYHAIARVPVNRTGNLFARAINNEPDATKRKDYSLESRYLRHLDSLPAEGGQAPLGGQLVITNVPKSQEVWLDLNTPIDGAGGLQFGRGETMRIEFNLTEAMVVSVFQNDVIESCQLDPDRRDLNNERIAVCSFQALPREPKLRGGQQQAVGEYTPLESGTFGRASFNFLLNNTGPVFMSLKPLTFTREISVRVTSTSNIAAPIVYAVIMFVYVVFALVSMWLRHRADKKNNPDAKMEWKFYAKQVLTFADLLSDILSITVNLATNPLLAIISAVVVGLPALFRFWFVIPYIMQVKPFRNFKLIERYQTSLGYFIKGSKLSTGGHVALFLATIIDLDAYKLLSPMIEAVPNHLYDVHTHEDLDESLEKWKLGSNLVEDVPQLGLQIALLNLIPSTSLSFGITVVSCVFSGAGVLFAVLKMLYWWSISARKEEYDGKSDIEMSETGGSRPGTPAAEAGGRDPFQEEEDKYKAEAARGGATNSNTPTTLIGEALERSASRSGSPAPARTTSTTVSTMPGAPGSPNVGASQGSSEGQGGSSSINVSPNMGWLVVKPGEFTKDGVIGEGSYGKVYKGESNYTKVAIKELHLQKFTNQEQADAFVRELEIMSFLHSPNLVGLTGLCVDEGSVSVLMELVDGCDLYKLLHEHKRKLSMPQVLEVAKEVATGMVVLHNFHTPVMHGDLKSANVLVTSRGDIKLTDYGLMQTKYFSREWASRRRAWQWMSPEQTTADDPSEYDLRTDVYSFGTLLHEMCTGEVPFEGHMDEVDLMKKWLKHPSFQDEVGADAHGPFATLIQACWASDPADRPSFHQIRDDLASISSNIGHDEHLSSIMAEVMDR